MKYGWLFLISTLWAAQVCAQQKSCFLWSLKNPDDKVYQDGKRVPVHGTVDLTKDLLVNDPSAMLHLQDENGRLFTVSFRNGKKVVMNLPEAEHSELYEIIVTDYLKSIQHITSHLTGKPYDMDWLSYFNNFETDSGKRLLIIDNEEIPLKSKFITLVPGQELYARVYQGSDSSVHKLVIRNEILTLNAVSFGLNPETRKAVFRWKLQLGYSKDNHQLYTDISEVLKSRLIDLNELKEEMVFFAGNRSIAPNELEQRLKSFLFATYGKYNSLMVDPLISRTGAAH